MKKLVYAYTDDFLRDEVFQKGIQLVYEECRNKVLRTRGLQDQVRSLVGGLLLQECFSEYYKISRKKAGTEIALGYNPQGKPYLQGKQKLFFNISHNANIAACGFSDREVGIDIARDSADYMKIARRFFLPHEVTLLEKKENEEERKQLFRVMWSVKESYVKLTGEGLTRGMDWFEIHYENRQITEPERKYEAACYETYSVGEFEISCASYEDEINPGENWTVQKMNLNI